MILHSGSRLALETSFIPNLMFSLGEQALFSAPIPEACRVRCEYFLSKVLYTP